MASVSNDSSSTSLKYLNLTSEVSKASGVDVLQVMNYSMEDYLTVVAPHLHTDLVSPQALSHLQTLAKFLPPFFHAGFECRLGTDSSPAVDLTVFIPRRLLNLPASPLLTHTIWQNLQAFCEEWVKPTSFLHSRVKMLGLEFDVNEHSPSVPIPSLFVEFNPETDRDDTFTLIDLICKQFNHPVSNKKVSNLQQCIHQLPEGARITYLGLMLPRPTEAVRVIVEALQPDQISEYLRRIGLAGPTAQLETIVQSFSNLVDSIGFVGFDVSDIIQARIGLEGFFTNQPQDEPRWQLFFDYLIEKGLCNPAKRDAMLMWPGFSQKDTDSSLWPDHLNFGDAFLADKAVSVFFRKINHIKIVYQHDKPLEAKGYLAFGHRWLDRSIQMQETE